MFRTRIIYRLIGLLLAFALMIVVPYSFTVVKQVQKMIDQEERSERVTAGAENTIHKEFTSRIAEEVLPFIFYIIIMALLLSIFFLRKMLISLHNLRDGSQAMRDGNLNVQLSVLTDDEIGEVTRAFNDMSSVLRQKTQELVQKDLYINAMLDPLWVVDEEDKILDINPAFTRLFGYGRDEVIGASVYDFLDEKNARIMRHQLETRRSRGESSIYELSVFSRNATAIPVLVSGSPIFSGDKVIAKIGILKDFREQGSLRRDLQQSLEYIETLMSSIPDEMLVIDRNFRIVMANRIATEHAERDLTGDFCHQALHASVVPCWSEGHECPTQSVFSSGRSKKTIHKHIDANGSMRYHEILASPVKDASGGVQHVIELLRDVTDRVKDEDAIVRKNQELTVLNSVSGILNRSLKPDEIFTKVLSKVTELLSLDGGGIFFLDEDTKEMVCQYHSGISEEYIRTIGRIRLGEDLPGRVAVTGQIIATSDISRDHRIERSVMKHSGIRGYCCIPVKGKERIIGVLCLFSFRPHLFTPDEENILSSIGEMTGMALENIRLYEKMRGMYEHQRRRWEDERRQLLALSSQLGAEVEIEDVMGQVLSLMKQIFRADLVWLLANDHDGNLVLRASVPATGREQMIVYAADVSSIEKFALSRRKTVVAPDMRAEEKFYLSTDIAMYHSAVAVPMFVGDKPVGVYTLYYSMQKELKEDELHFIEIIANMVSVAMERSQFHMRAGKEKELADAILRSVTDGIITLDMGGKVLALNPAFERMTGIDHAFAVGIPACDNFRFSDENIDFRIKLGESVEEAKQGSSSVRSAVMMTRYGKSLPVTINSSPILDKGGNVTGVVNLIRDVSRERELDRMKTELVRSVSHEFRTPLSAIVGMTEMLLQRDVEGEKVDRYLSIIRNEGLRLTKMVAELLSIARIESGKETLQLSRIELDAFLKTICETVSTLVEGKGGRISYRLQDVAVLLADEEKLRQVLLNLIDNALTFSDRGCMIDIDVHRDGKMVAISVRDTGWGIPEEDIPRLAERFYRGMHGDKVKGTGLGLSLCDEIVKMHGGTMTISSVPGDGTTVVVGIPYREAW